MSVCDCRMSGATLATSWSLAPAPPVFADTGAWPESQEPRNPGPGVTRRILLSADTGCVTLLVSLIIPCDVRYQGQGGYVAYDMRSYMSRLMDYRQASKSQSEVNPEFQIPKVIIQNGKGSFSDRG